MSAKVILNPYAGRWKALQKRPEVEAALRTAGLDYQLVVTEAPGHGIQLAYQAVQEGFAPIISAGGDGSISEVINGVLLACGDDIPPPVGIVPLGTANDLVVNLHLPTDLAGSARIIAEGKTMQLDVGLVRYETSSPEGMASNGRYFDNNSAIGLEPTVTLIQEEIHRLKGVLRYLLATLIGVYRNPKWTMRIEWDGGSYQGPVTLVTVGNNPLTGGLFYMTPHADPFDGKLTFVHGYMRTRMQILRLLPRTMKPGLGSYVEHPAIHEVHTSWIKVHSEQPTPLHADGEIQSHSVQDLEYQIIPSRLPVLMAQFSPNIQDKA